MKSLSLALVLGAITNTAGNDCCANDNNLPNISLQNPVAWSVHPTNEIITFKAYVNDLCGISKIFINMYDYAMERYVKLDTLESDCPPSYFCVDYSFPASGQNWYV